MRESSAKSPDDYHNALIRYHRAKPHWGVAIEPMVERIDKAVVAPISNCHLNELSIAVQNSCVFYPDRRPCALSLHVAGPILRDNVVGPFPAAVPKPQTGTFLYGGLLVPHFGHFLIESLSRLWALPEVGPIEGVVFVKDNGLHGKDPASFIGDAFRLLGINSLIYVDREPMSFERLIVPSQIFGFNQSQGHPKFHALVHRLRSVKAAGPASSIYVSRARLSGAGAGGVVCEEIIEENLRAYGYEIIYPEDLTLEQQLHAYNRADKAIFAEGSAAILFGFVAHSDHSVAIIRRRFQDVTFIRQIHKFGKTLPHVINCITGHALREQGDAAAYTALARLDFDQLGIQLQKRGFIPHRKFWRAPSHEECERSLARLVV